MQVRTQDYDRKQLYPYKDTLIDRIILKIESHFETTCDECEVKFRNKLSDQEEPLLSCYLCYQGSHNCDETKAKFEPIRQYLSDAEGKLNGINWLCCGCRKNNDLALTPKSKKARNEPSESDPSESHREDNGEAEEDQSDGEDDEEQEEVPEERSPRRNREIIQNSDICPLYKKMQCPHGLTGKRLINEAPCNKAHPPRCLKYCRFANDNKLGCTKGKECRYYHPTLCRHSVKRRVCLVVDCKFTHLNGTKKYDPDLRVNQRSQQNRDHIPGQPQVQVTATPIAQARTILQQTPSVHLPVNRIQNQLQQQKTHPGRITDANSADNSFLNLSKLPQILDQMNAQQKEMQAQLLSQQPVQMPHNVPHIQQEPQTTLQQALLLIQRHRIPMYTNLPQQQQTVPWNLYPTLPYIY